MYLSRIEEETKQMQQEINKIELMQKYQEMGASIGTADRLATAQANRDTDGYNTAYNDLLKEHTQMLKDKWSNTQEKMQQIREDKEDLFLKGFWGDKLNYPTH